MKILVIPDIHQNLKTFKKYYDIDMYDRIICLGDYVDDWKSADWWNTTDHNPIAVMSELIELKKQNPNKINLLIGNHDWAYFKLTRENEFISGHQCAHQVELNKFFEENYDLFNVAWYEDGWIFSHAGFAGDFMSKLRSLSGKETPADCIAFLNNEYLKHSEQIDLDFVGPNPAGENRFERCLWIRPRSLIIWNDLQDYHQVVGHTECDKVLHVTYEHKSGEIYVIDSSEHSNAMVVDTETNEVNILSSTELEDVSMSEAALARTKDLIEGVGSWIV